MVVETEVTKHHRGTEDHGRRVRLIRALDVHSGVTAARLVEGVLAADVGAWHDAWATDQRGTDVRHNVTIQVGRHDHVKLVRAADELHRRVVDDHVIGLDTRALVLLGDATERVEEQTVTELHDIGLVDTGDLLAVVLEGEVEREASDALGLVARHDLERLDNAGRGAVLQATVLTLGVFTDDRKINVRVARLQSLERAAEHHRGKDIELLTHRNVPAVVGTSARGRHKRALQTDLGAAQTVSHSMGTFKRSKISLTESVISFPTPSPGINVAVYTPPYLVGPCERQSLYTYLGQTRRLCHQRRHRARHLA